MTAQADLVRLAGRELLAPAKINLALHVTGQRADGYHTLSSLVAFAAHGDVLSVSAAERDVLHLAGPFADALGSASGAENIVWKALALARAVALRAGNTVGPLALHLDKRLPVASGIGGGSADAAALLRLLARALPALATELREAALGLGADVPMCLDGFPARVEGIGEHAQPLQRFPETACLLVNPGGSIATPAVFRLLQHRTNAPLPALPGGGFATPDRLIDYLRGTRNDLEAAATQLAPAIAEVTRALDGEGARFARMSGSGATVFGLFDSVADAEAAGQRIAAEYPSWWTMATRLMPAGPQKEMA